MVGAGSAADMSGLKQPAFGVKGDAQLFFQPVEFDFQLANLLVERCLERFLLFGLGATPARKNLRELLSPTLSRCL